MLNFWFQGPSFHKVVKEIWQNFQVEGQSAYVLKEKLKITKQALKRWNLEEFGNLKKKKKDAQLEMNSLDLSEEERSLCSGEQMTR